MPRRVARLSRSLLPALVVLSFAASWTTAQAQETAASMRPVAIDSAAPSRRALFTRGDLALAAGFTGLTVAFASHDRSIARRLQNPYNQENRFLKNSSHGLELLATPGAHIVGASMYVVGRVANKPTIADVGLHGTEAVLLASTITNVIKRFAGRSRPYVTGDSIGSDYQFRGGFEGTARQSFPSGHTTTAFAAASAVTGEMHRLYPKSVWYVAPVMYGGATFVGLSRMYNNKHWATDVVVGAAIGTFTGLKMVRFAHTGPTKKLDRYLLRPAVTPTRDGIAVSFSVEPD